LKEVERLETFTAGRSHSEHGHCEENVLESEGWSHRIKIDIVDRVKILINEILRSFSVLVLS